MKLAQELSEVVTGDVTGDITVRRRYSHDASIFQAIPEVVVYPRSSEDIQYVVRYASEHQGCAIVARGGGTDMGGGAISSSIVLDTTKYLNALGDIARDQVISGQDGHAVVQPGMWYRDFEKATLARGLILPTYPGSREICAVGGMVANNAAGERSLAYGQTVDYVRLVRAVMADGNEYEFGPLTKAELDVKMAQQDFEGGLYRGIYRMIEDNYDAIQAARPRVAKNASGYYLWRVWNRHTFNMAKLLCGSQGTLGVITQATLGLVRPHTQRQMLIVFLKDIAPVARIVNALLRFNPESIESFDDKTLSFTLRFLPDYIKRLGAKNLFSLAWQFLPEVRMVLTGGLPKLILISEFTGDDITEVRTRAAAAAEALGRLGVKVRLAKNEQEAKKYWTVRRESFNVLRAHATGKRTTPFIDDFIIKPEHMPEFLPRLEAILKPYKLALTIAGHAGSGNFHIIPLMDLRQASARKIIPELSRKVYELVLEYHGSITAEHNDGLIRGPYVEQMFGKDMYNLFRQVKKLFDPKGIFNPGKKIDVDWKWAMEHMRMD